MSLRSIHAKNCTWVNVPEQSERALRELKADFGFLDSDIKESLPPLQRSKITERQSYLFIVLHFPIYDGLHERLRFTEIDFFITPYALVTVHENELHTIKDTFRRAEHDDGLRAELCAGTVLELFLSLWRKSLEFSFGSVMHVNDDINWLDRKLHQRIPSREIMEELLRLRTNIVTLRRTLGPQRLVLNRLREIENPIFKIKKNFMVLDEMEESLEEMWALLESHLETSKALHEAVESVVAVHTNEAMKIFTVISVITFPLTLIATLFAVRAGGTPLVSNPYGFWILFWIIMAGAGIMLRVFKKKGLL